MMQDALIEAAMRVGWGDGTAVDYELLDRFGYKTAAHDSRRVQTVEEKIELYTKCAELLYRDARIARERHVMGLPHQFEERSSAAQLYSHTARMHRGVYHV